MDGTARAGEGGGPTGAQAAYLERRARLVEALRRQRGPVRLAKDTSNLFRDRKETGDRPLDVRDFRHVLRVDPEARLIEVEGMTPYQDAVRAALARGLMPAVVPQLRSITVGGATTGVGIEASSFRYGLVHETVRELEVLTGSGEVVVARPDNEHRDLYYGFPNSYGTLGYALRLVVQGVPVRPYVRIEHHRHSDPERYFEALAAACAREDVDFVDGTVFSPQEMYLTLGHFVDQAPYTSDYSFERIYYRSIREREEDYLTVEDFIWRWDTDWFWCSKNVFAQHWLVRRLLGRERLNSITYTKIMRWNARLGLTRRIERLLGLHSESVIQDVDIPVDRAVAFFRFYFDTIRFTPVWICPVRPYDPQTRFPLYPMEDRLYVNFGFWDVIRTREAHPPGHFNRLVERKVQELGGIKSLYSDSYFEPEEFWAIYGGETYRRLKERYDPQGVLKDLYRKCVLRE